jgi:regulator-associated protein of mTOR
MAPAMRPKGPQPVLDSLTEPADDDSSTDSQGENQARPKTAPRLDAPLNGFAFHRSSTQIFLDNNERRRSSRNASPADIATRRPGLLRAKSDFGPRREDVVKDDDDGKNSEAGEWGIRHGFETQLVSEEYNSILNAVFISIIVRRDKTDLTSAELLPLLHRQEARNGR